MSILKIYRGRALQAALAEIIRPVRVIYVATDQPEPVTVQALADLMKSTPNLSVDFRQDTLAEVDRIIVQVEAGPALVFVGPPLGTELAALISVIIVVGRGRSGLSPTTLYGLTDLSGPVHLTVFTTPT